jgi:hypothetical protein
MGTAALSTSPDGSAHDGLARIADAFDAGSARAAIPAVAEEGRTRRWALLYRDRRVEAWAIAWPEGSGLGLHDHDGSAAGVRLVAGRLRERYLDGDGLTVRWWNEGGRYDLPRDHVHEVVNVDAGEAVSIHVYSPPLGDIRFRQDM